MRDFWEIRTSCQKERFPDVLCRRPGSFTVREKKADTAFGPLRGRTERRWVCEKHRQSKDGDRRRKERQGGKEGSENNDHIVCMRRFFANAQSPDSTLTSRAEGIETKRVHFFVKSGFESNQQVPEFFGREADFKHTELNPMPVILQQVRDLATTGIVFDIVGHHKQISHEATPGACTTSKLQLKNTTLQQTFSMYRKKGIKDSSHQQAMPKPGRACSTTLSTESRQNSCRTRVRRTASIDNNAFESRSL
jgi:hypothetical protein